MSAYREHDVEKVETPPLVHDTVHPDHTDDDDGAAGALVALDGAPINGGVPTYNSGTGKHTSQVPGGGSPYTDEMAQDAVGGMVDTSLVYVDATPLLQRAALTGDVTASAGSNATTIANDAVTYAKMQDVTATSRILGRKTAGSGIVEELTPSDVLTLIGGSPSPGSGLPYMYPFKDAIDDPIDDNFRGASIDTSGARRSGATAWTALNIGGSAVTVGDGSLWLESPASAGVNMRGYEQPVPSGNWCIRANLGSRHATKGDSSEKAVGMFLRDSVGGKIEWWALGHSGGTPIIWAAQLTNATTYSGTRATTALSGTNFPSFLEIEYDGTNYYLRFGSDESNMVQQSSAYQFAKTSFLANTADMIGVFAINTQSIATTLICGGFYRVSESPVL